MRALLSCALLIWAFSTTAQGLGRELPSSEASVPAADIWKETANKTATTNKLEDLGNLRKLIPGRSQAPLTPGVYEAKPYTMIVKVPEFHADDQMIHPRDRGLRMPMTQPDLEFVPRKGGLQLTPLPPPATPPRK